MRVFITGVTGYLGGAIAHRLKSQGHTISGLARSSQKAAALEERGIEPVLGSLSDLSLIVKSARSADATINTASAEDSPCAFALAEALEDSGKALLHTSGTSVAADRAIGEYGRGIVTEDVPLNPLPERLLRVAVEQIVLASAAKGVRSIVIRPSLVYGRGQGLNPHSHQLPRLAQVALERGRPAHVGRGLNIWSHVYIEDLVQLYLLALNNAPAGSVFYAESGEATWRDMAAALGTTMCLDDEPECLSLDTSLHIFGPRAISSYGSNSRVSAERARRMLDWKPTGPSLWDDIATNYYKAGFAGVTLPS